MTRSAKTTQFSFAGGPKKKDFLTLSCLVRHLLDQHPRRRRTFPRVRARCRLPYSSSMIARGRLFSLRRFLRGYLYFHLPTPFSPSAGTSWAVPFAYSLCPSAIFPVSAQYTCFPGNLVPSRTPSLLVPSDSGEVYVCSFSASSISHLPTLIRPKSCCLHSNFQALPQTRWYLGLTLLLNALGDVRETLCGQLITLLGMGRKTRALLRWRDSSIIIGDAVQHFIIQEFVNHPSQPFLLKWIENNMSPIPRIIRFTW